MISHTLKLIYLTAVGVSSFTTGSVSALYNNNKKIIPIKAMKADRLNFFMINPVYFGKSKLNVIHFQEYLKAAF